MLEQLTLFQVDSLANHTQLQGKEKEKKMNAIYGPKCLEQFKKLNHVGLWAKMFADLLVGMEGWFSTRCNLIWKIQGTKYNRFYFQLQVSTLPTEEIGFGLLPTPTASCHEAGCNTIRKDRGDLRTDVLNHLWKIETGQNYLEIGFVMEMMGFPPEIGRAHV